MFLIRYHIPKDKEKLKCAPVLFLQDQFSGLQLFLFFLFSSGVRGWEREVEGATGHMEDRGRPGEGVVE